jgi:membrane protease subunit HflK
MVHHDFSFGVLMSLNDPQWGNRGNDNGGGKRPNQGPPDLEQLWRDLNRRLSGIFDKKRAAR